MRSLIITLFICNVLYFCQCSKTLHSPITILNCIIENGRPGNDRNIISTTVNTDVLIKKAGFQPEVHQVVTEDGYILHLTRIKTSKRGPPVLIIHGLFLATDMWVSRGRKEDLAFILADNGFDVWLGDCRGNIYSRKHKSLDPNGPDFYDFSFHEIAIHDLPAFIKEILKYSSYKKIFYIGYSMGSTAFTILTSVLPKYNDYIQTAVLLAPAIYSPPKMKSKIIKFVFDHIYAVAIVLATLGQNEVKIRREWASPVVDSLCKHVIGGICYDVIGDLFGEHRRNLNKTRFWEFARLFSSSTGLKTVLHFAQIENTDEFKQFDFTNTKMNMKVYGQPKPPFYPLGKISTPVVTFCSRNDHLSSELTAERLAKSLPNVVYKRTFSEYSHIDFAFGIDAPKVLYSKILYIFKNKKYHKVYKCLNNM